MYTTRVKDKVPMMDYKRKIIYKKNSLREDKSIYYYSAIACTGE